MEKDSIKQAAPMAVYHYSASVGGQPVQYDGVITCPVISGEAGYIAAKGLIAEQVEAAHIHLVRVHSLSFVGETAPK